jgi:hypothetical protein
VYIEETDKLAKLKKVILNTPAGDWFAFNPEKGRDTASRMSALLAVGGAHNHHRACDCVVIVNQNGVLTVVYFELKSGNPVGYVNQFKSTRQFVHYALGLLDEFHGIKFPAMSERYVVLFGGRPALLQKTPTGPKREKMEKTQPDKPYRKEVHDKATLYLKEFLY